MTEEQFKQFCSELNEKCRKIAEADKETVPDELAFQAITVIRLLRIKTIGDAFLYSAALNLLNTYVKQDPALKKKIGYFFKRNAEFIGKFFAKNPNDLVSVEMSMDQGLSLLIVSVGGIQFSFHQVALSEEMKPYFTAENAKRVLPWDGIRKQRCARTLFEAALGCGYDFSDEAMDGSAFLPMLKSRTDDFHAGKYKVEDAKDFGRDASSRSGNTAASARDDFSITQHITSAPGKTTKRALPSAKLYESTFAAFCEAETNRTLIPFLEERYRHAYGTSFGDVMALEYKFSLSQIRDILEDNHTSPDCGIRIDYVRNRIVEFINVILASRSPDGQSFRYAVIEMVGWHKMKRDAGEDMVRFLDEKTGAMVRAIHPCYQVQNYQNYLSRGIAQDQFEFLPCVFLYDCVPGCDTDIVPEETEELLSRVPVYYADQRDGLADYLKDVIGSGGGTEALNALYDRSAERFSYGTEELLYDDRKYVLESLLERYRTKKGPFLATVDGMEGTGKGIVIGKLEEALGKLGVKTLRISKSAPDSGEKADALIYDGVIPEQLEDPRAAVSFLFFDPLKHTDEELECLADLKEEAERTGRGHCEYSLKTVIGFTDDGEGLNWLIRHFRLGRAECEAWNPRRYSITLCDAPGSPEKDIAEIRVPDTVTYDPETKRLSMSQQERIALYEAFSAGKAGVRLFIPDPGLRDYIRGELENANGKYSWIKKYTANLTDSPEAGDTLLDAQGELLSEDVIRNKYTDIAIDALGESAWNKLCDYSRSQILSGMLGYFDMKDYNMFLDFSGVVVQICKAVEAEMAFRFCEKYRHYLEETLGEDWISKLPAEVTENFCKNGKPLETAMTTLGSIPFICGFYRGETPCEEYTYFAPFAKDRLFLQGTENIPGLLCEQMKVIRYIKDTFRNKAAHQNAINMIQAKQCIDFIVLSQRKLGELLDAYQE